MKKHSILSLFLVIVLLCGLLSACGAKEENAPAPTAEPTAAPTPTAEPSHTPEPDPTMTEEELLAYMKERTVLMQGEDPDGAVYTATGCFMDTEGTVLTSFYAALGMTALRAQMADEKVYDAGKVIGFDTVTNLALVKLSEESLVENESEEGLTVAMTPPETKTFAEPKHELKDGDTVYFYNADEGTLSANTVLKAEEPFGALKCFEVELTEQASKDAEANVVAVNGYGELLGLDPFVISIPDEESGEYADALLCPLASMAETIECDKELTLEEFNDWFADEIALCWGPIDQNGECYFSFARTYQDITGRECTKSYNTAGGSIKGYRMGAFQYDYVMSVEDFDVYAEYLKSIGYAFEGSDLYMDGTSYYYWNENEGICIDLFVSADSTTLSIYPKYGYIA